MKVFISWSYHINSVLQKTRWAFITIIWHFECDVFRLLCFIVINFNGLLIQIISIILSSKNNKFILSHCNACMFGCHAIDRLPLICFWWSHISCTSFVGFIWYGRKYVAKTRKENFSQMMWKIDGFKCPTFT